MVALELNCWIGEIPLLRASEQGVHPCLVLSRPTADTQTPDSSYCSANRQPNIKLREAIDIDDRTRHHRQSLAKRLEPRIEPMAIDGSDGNSEARGRMGRTQEQLNFCSSK